MQDLSDPRGFGYGRATVQAEIGGRTYRLAALDGFEENVGAVYRTLGGRNTEPKAVAVRGDGGGSSPCVAA